MISRNQNISYKKNHKKHLKPSRFGITDRLHFMTSLIWFTCKDIVYKYS